MTEGADLSRAAALRIGLAARVLPETQPARLMAVLVDALGLPLTEAKLDGLSVKSLKTAKDGEFADIDPVYLKQALKYLKGEQTDAPDASLPQPEAFAEGDMPGSVRVAFASNTGQQMDGHFGSCVRFLVYQVDPDEARLIDVRPIEEPDVPTKDERTAYRVSLIDDCHILYVASIGGPPAAKVVNAGVHPIKYAEATDVSILLTQLQTTLKGSPPPWLAKIMGKAVHPTGGAEEAL